MNDAPEEMNKIRQLLPLMMELRDLGGAIDILSWDQETFMPAQAVESRSYQLAALQGIYHQKLVAPELGELLCQLGEDNGLTLEEQAIVRNLKWEHDRAVRVPSSLVKELAQRQSWSVESWRIARKQNDFSMFCPHLEAITKLKRDYADALGHDGERYDALLEGFEPGMRVAQLASVFESLRKQLSSLVWFIRESKLQFANPWEGCSFALDKQWEFSLRLLRDMGFDFEKGRQDRSSHPFTGGGRHPCDVRLTTRLAINDPLSGWLGSIHEGGHGLYEQGFPLKYARTYLAQAPSYGVHESQSRFWENCVGRSFSFWRHYFPELKKLFVDELNGIELETFWKYLNRVEPTLIRVESDEVTYNLHILVRFELELELMRNQIEPSQLPEAWRARMKQYLGVEPQTDSEGVLQDIHWAWGEFGYFPTYTLGNLYAAMIYEKIQGDLPNFEKEIGCGSFASTLHWLREKIHQKGFIYPAQELLEQATQMPLSEKPYIDYLEKKYRLLYG